VRRWRVVALVGLPVEGVTPEFRVAASRWTRRGAARTAARWSRQGRPWGPFVECYGYGYRHRDEHDPC
jgi:hypothetical protein